ncbi:MAG: hypothetical protein JWM99_855 [Verrucomicrobiales bacterium]|nr:hypothetical protein [Verrucomicrobiales bacterium]
MKQFTLPVLIAVIMHLSRANAQNVSVNFNTPGDLANKFNVYQNATPPLVVSPGAATSPYSQTTSGGAGGGGGVGINSGTGITADSTGIYKNSSFNFANSGTTVTITSLLNVTANTGGGNRLLQLGFVNENTSGMNGNAGLAFMSLRLSTVGTSGNVYTPNYQIKDAASGTSGPSFTPNVTLAPGEWYQLSGTFQNLGGGAIQISGTLKDFGIDGTTPGDTIFTYPTQTLTAIDIASDSSVWPAFRAFKNDGAAGIDSFTATSTVPEPGTLVLMGAGISGLLIAARRRR